MKLRWQITLIILFSLAFNSLINILLAQYQQHQLLEASHQTFSQTLIHSNTINLLLASLFSTALLLCIGYYFTRKLTRPITNLTQVMREYDGNQTFIEQAAEGEFEEFRLLRETLFGVAKTQNRALKQSYSREQELAVTLNSIGDAVITTDAEGLVAHMNPVAEQLTAWCFASAKGMPLKTVLPLIDASTRESIDDPSDKVLNSGKIIHEKHPQVITTQLASSFTGEHHIIELIDNHPAEILHKPYTAQTLLNRVFELLVNHREQGNAKYDELS